MEFERTLFRVHERFLSLGFVKKTIGFIYKACAVLFFVLLPLFIYANGSYLNQSACLKPIVDKNFMFDPDDNINRTNTTVLGLKTLIKTYDFVRIRVADVNNKNLNLSDPTQIVAGFDISGSSQILNMDPKMRTSHNFTEHNITVPSGCYSGSFVEDILLFFVSYENILINEQLVAFGNNISISLKNVETLEQWSFSKGEIENLYGDGFFSHIGSRLFQLIKLFIGLFLVSNITAIYNKMTIICAPIFILAAYKFCSTPAQRNIDRMNIYRAFPWIGMYLYTLNNNRRKNDRYIICAFLCMIVVFYCLYLAALSFWNLFLFNKSLPKGLDESFYGVIALLEFLVLLFARTRTTLKFFPQMSLLTMMIFLYYVQFTAYGFYQIALLMMAFAILAQLMYFLHNFEVAATNWNPSYHYTPSAESPRCLYSPIFSMSWYHDLPQLWTMFFPMYGRSHFSETELSMVNGNYSLLVQTLDRANQRNRGNNPAAGNQGIANPNNIEFPMQPMENANEENNTDAEEASRRNSRNSNPGQQNLLQNADADYVLDISDETNNRRGNWIGAGGGNENTGNNYRSFNE